MVIEDDAVVPEDRRSQAPEIVNQLIARLDTAVDQEWDLLYLGRVLQRGKSDLVPPSKPSPTGEFSLGKSSISSFLPLRGSFLARRT
jgi:hypothetical protein